MVSSERDERVQGAQGSTPAGRPEAADRRSGADYGQGDAAGSRYSGEQQRHARIARPTERKVIRVSGANQPTLDLANVVSAHSECPAHLRARQSSFQVPDLLHLRRSKSSHCTAALHLVADVVGVRTPAQVGRVHTRRVVAGVQRVAPVCGLSRRNLQRHDVRPTPALLRRVPEPPVALGRVDGPGPRNTAVSLGLSHVLSEAFNEGESLGLDVDRRVTVVSELLVAVAAPVTGPALVTADVASRNLRAYGTGTAVPAVVGARPGVVDGGFA